jgi:hypothetical protein
VKTFLVLRELHEFRKRHLTFLKTVEDIELIREIGYGQSIGRPLTLKTLFLQGIASHATVQRRLNRMRKIGVIHQQRADHDRRLAVLTLDPKILKLYEQIGRLMRKA